MKTQSNCNSKQVRIFVRFTLLLCILFMFAVNSFAQRQVIEKQDSENYKVRFTYMIPQHLPLTVEVRNLDKENWLGEFEIEVTNTSEKSIYFLNFHLVFPDTKDSTGAKTSMTLRYGRHELAEFSNSIRAEDTPLKSKESCIIKLPVRSIEGWRKAKVRLNFAEPKIIKLLFQILRFEDGSGYIGTGGIYVTQAGGLL